MLQQLDTRSRTNRQTAGQTDSRTNTQTEQDRQTDSRTNKHTEQDRQPANWPGVTSPLLSCLLEELDTDRMPGDAPSPSAGLKTEPSIASLAHCWLTARSAVSLTVLYAFITQPVGSLTVRLHHTTCCLFNCTPSSHNLLCLYVFSTQPVVSLFLQHTTCCVFNCMPSSYNLLCL